MITVYSKPNCQPCRITKQALQAKGVEFKEVDASADPEAQAFLASLGYRGVPVVHVSDEQHWQGFQPDLIRAL